MFYAKHDNDKSKVAAIQRRRDIVMREDEYEDDEDTVPTVQTKLEINSPNDIHEQHADEIANKVSNNEDASQLVKNQPTLNSTPQKKSDGNLKGTDQLQT